MAWRHTQYYNIVFICIHNKDSDQEPSQTFLIFLYADLLIDVFSMLRTYVLNAFYIKLISSPRQDIASFCISQMHPSRHYLANNMPCFCMGISIWLVGRDLADLLQVPRDKQLAHPYMMYLDADSYPTFNKWIRIRLSQSFSETIVRCRYTDTVRLCLKQCSATLYERFV